MTQNSSDEPQANGEEQEASEPSPQEEYARQVAEVVGAERWSADFGHVKVFLEPDDWVSALSTAREELGLSFFSFLSAIDWSRTVEVGDPPDEADSLEERFEVICHLSSIEGPEQATFSVELPKEEPALDSLTDLFGGADWHEREAHEMFGIEFRGHPNLIKLYLPDAFEGHPLRKSFPLLTREVKPWPGLVDVEGIPHEEEEAQKAQYENPESAGESS